LKIEVKEEKFDFVIYLKRVQQS